ncbi:transporter [Pseudodesulfovibrio sp. JC047]|uniref:transporter n=1 Tax=Pseudodesulfovibrio sp. JC047 TaxID=2683199 RepID=UPI0013D18AF0|nr:transporter [Pseudodesulfovibrio sp. JC047]NDV18558.1 transporter [Pseudodesulfovibrio sp. JC047]
MKCTTGLLRHLFLLAALLLFPVAAHGESNEALAKKLANPVANMISVPIQINFDDNRGPNKDGERWTTNIQPVIPVELSEEWNLISRTIIPIIHQDAVNPGTGGQSGVGDLVQSFFFSPAAPTETGWIWGAGPVFLLPTGSNDSITADKWGLGPTGVALKQAGPWTFGGLFNHVWSFAGNDDRDGINATYLQPFVAYTTPEAWTFALNTESTYDWKNHYSTIPINLTASKMTEIMGQKISVGAGIRQWLDSPENGPKGTGFRFTFTFIFPK